MLYKLQKLKTKINYVWLTQNKRRAKRKPSWPLVHDYVATTWGYCSTSPALVHILLIFIYISYNDKYNMYGITINRLSLHSQWIFHVHGPVIGLLILKNQGVNHNKNILWLYLSKEKDDWNVKVEVDGWMFYTAKEFICWLVSFSCSTCWSWLIDWWGIDKCRFYLLACKSWCMMSLLLILPVLIGFIFPIIFLASTICAFECGTYCVMIRVVRCVSVYCWTFI